MVGCLGPSRPAALSVEGLIIVLAGGWGAWQARATIARRGPHVLRVPSRTVDDPSRPARPIRLEPLDPGRRRGIWWQHRMTSQKSYQR
jgi:hypothetical protein